MNKLDKSALPIWQLFLYLIMIGFTFISMPKGGIFYLVARGVQALEMIFFIALCVVFYRQGIRFNKFNTQVNIWWLFYLFITYAFTIGVGLTPVLWWINVVIFLLLGTCYWQNNPQDSYRYIAIAFSLLIYLNAILLVLFPEGLWIDPDWVGRGDPTRHLFGNYNQIGFVCLLGISVQAMYTLSTQKGWTNLCLLVVTSLFSVIYTGSMTSAVGLSILAMYLLVHKFIKRPKIYLAAFIVVYILFFMLIVWYGNSIEEIKIATNFIEGTLSKDTSFSYRTTIWGNAVYKISQSPWIGYGVQNVEWNMTYLDGSGPHNLWLMLLLQGGVSLCSAFVFIVVHIVRHALKTPGYSTTLSVVSICVVFIMSLFETYPIVPIFVLLQFVYYSPLLETTRK